MQVTYRDPWRSFCTLAAAALVAGLVVAQPASGVVVPFSEDFTDNSAQWLNTSRSAFLEWLPGGGPDGGSHARSSANFALNEPEDTVVTFRGEDQTASLGFAASGGAFVGDWITAGVRQLTAQVRHDLDQPLAYFLRLAPAPANFPGAFAFTSPVPPNQWTEIRFAVRPDSLTFPEGSGSFETVINRVGNVQIGVFVPESLAGVDQSFLFDIDKVTLVVPEAAGGWLLTQGLACLAVLFLSGFRRQPRGPRDPHPHKPVRQAPQEHDPVIVPAPTRSTHAEKGR